jgi:hypothetical protein
MSALDQKVQQAQDYLASIAEDGSYMHEVIDLLDELYALTQQAAPQENLSHVSELSDEQVKAQIAYGKRCAAAWTNTPLNQTNKVNK